MVVFWAWIDTATCPYLLDGGIPVLFDHSSLEAGPVVLGPVVPTGTSDHTETTSPCLSNRSNPQLALRTDDN